MKLRNIAYPASIAWLSPLLTPDDLNAAATAEQLIDQARRQAKAHTEQAMQQLAELQAAARQTFLDQYAADFRQALTDLHQAREAVHQQLHQHARQVISTVLGRLGLELSLRARLEVVLQEVLSETLPAICLELRVSPNARSAMDELLRLRSGMEPDADGLYRLADLQLRLSVDASLADDEVLLMTPAGAQIRCAYEQAIEQLLSCV